jgi:hypothetical protein
MFPFHTRLAGIIMMAWLFLPQLFSGCASAPGNLSIPKSGTPATSESIVGTWRWYAVVEHPGNHRRTIDQPFFARFDADGACTTWPTPLEDAVISRGEYQIIDGTLRFENTEVNAPIFTTGDRMWYVTEDGTCYYQRVTPGLEPGQMP